MNSKAPHPLDKQEPGPGSENMRTSGERKFPARPGAGDRQAEDFLADNAREEAANTHLMEGVNVSQDETRQTEGTNPPGTYVTEGEKPEGDPGDRPDLAGESDRRLSREL
ncbi:MAG: hypothetical protein INR68_03525 [Methylobacterium mesophilicum]|nr:hypothetical protein [Methylobacterium mesophilicum]